MAKHEIMIHENTSATKESAPYLGSYISKETLKTDEFAAKIAEKCGLPAIQVQAIIAGAFDAIEELEKEELVRLHVDGLTVCGIITGSFPTADAKFDPERNALQLALRLDEGVRNALADVTPSIITDASLTRLRIDNLADLEVQRPQNLVHGQHVFRVAGFCMVLSDEGAEAYFENAMGTRFELVIDEIISKQLFTAHTAALLEGGDYKLVIKSRAGDAAGPLQTATKRVKYLRVVDPPTVTKATTAGCADDHLKFNQEDADTEVDGTGLALGEDDDVRLELYDAEGTRIDEFSAREEVKESSDTRITLGTLRIHGTHPESEWAGQPAKLVVVKDGARIAHDVTFDDL